ncbi:ArnT family glycosyltransferase [Gracilimonas mengyeensis]|uniref:Dolichyl-phosphate-mannose-protein mannosyltransferase n=1 Tax=Gracilimonas mengyeensis TaxID=1302730 RepID=A0A521CQU3_9BACT|nr:glycosyltransferase family 39 protein [Gracilimonas mengyeensis]SMO61803.1 Dolichyl-phosphate-mannose-protein mannosyltransferase [Gracilimonas mengyeensis]
MQSKKVLPIIAALGFIKLTIHWFGNQNYGFHRDELLHLSVSEHLAWGYFEFPPLIAWIGKLSCLLFDYSLMGMRLFPTLAGLGILILCCLMAKEMGGKNKAVFLAGICTLAFIPFFRNHLLFQPVAFDQFFWTLGFYLLIKFINTEKKEHLLLLGLVAGLGLLNKYTMLVWGFGIAIGLMFYERGRLYKSIWLYVSGVIAFLVFLPNLLWQIQHDMPFFLHMESLNQKQLSGIDPFEFGLAQLELPFTLVVSLIGLYGVIFTQHLKKYRSAGIAFLVIFATMWILKSKAYYFFAAYPVMFAAGAVQIEHWFQNRPKLNYVVAAVILLPIIPFVPEAIPILPIEKHIAYMDLEENEDGRVELTGDYADMFGWEEQVALVDSVYRSLSPQEQENAVIWAENYGEAGAIKILGDKYGLPDPISRHGSFWLWGYGNADAEVWISLGNEPEAVHHVFEEVELVKIITHKYAIGEENGIPLYICRKPKVVIPEWWQSYEEHVFD